MTCQEVVDVVLSRKLWHGKGETPAATLYSLVVRDIQKGAAMRSSRKSGAGTSRRLPDAYRALGLLAGPGWGRDCSEIGRATPRMGNEGGMRGTY